MTRRGMQAWKCEHGHVLGMIKSNARPPMLLLYRHAVDPEALPAMKKEIIGELFGTMRQIRCDLCGDVREWVARYRRSTYSR